MSVCLRSFITHALSEIAGNKTSPRQNSKKAYVSTPVRVNSESPRKAKYALTVNDYILQDWNPSAQPYGVQ
jgi:hypothetical protein